MAKMTRAQAKNRLLEAKKKIDAVFMSDLNSLPINRGGVMNFAEYQIIMKRLNKCRERLMK